ncbi:MAG: hypothetical protein IH853_11835 [Bacteroidetes bacterium]|nr:hypothetical protein [Bacteroidota bacterium]
MPIRAIEQKTEQLFEECRQGKTLATGTYRPEESIQMGVDLRRGEIPAEKRQTAAPGQSIESSCDGVNLFFATVESPAGIRHSHNNPLGDCSA